MLEKFWEKRDVFLKLNKSGSVPFLVKKASDDELSEGKQHTLLSGINAISEFLEDKYQQNPLIFGSPEEKSEIRRMVDWVNIKFYGEVVGYILNEKIINFFKNKEIPDPSILAIAAKNLSTHLDYFGYLIGKKGWIASHKISMADIALASHISVLDYLGVIHWVKMDSQNKENLKEWYRLIKSRPSFRQILQDIVPGFDASSYYRDLDFF